MHNKTRDSLRANALIRLDALLPMTPNPVSSESNLDPKKVLKNAGRKVFWGLASQGESDERLCAH
jgi:hypothetical protein